MRGERRANNQAAMADGRIRAPTAYPAAFYYCRGCRGL